MQKNENQPSFIKFDDFIIKELRKRTLSSAIGQLGLLGVFSIYLLIEGSFSLPMIACQVLIIVFSLVRILAKSEKQLGWGILFTSSGWGALFIFSLIENAKMPFIFVLNTFMLAGLTSGSLFSLGHSKKYFTAFVAILMISFSVGTILFGDQKMTLGVILILMIFFPFLLKQRSLYFEEVKELFRINHELEEQRIQLVTSAKMAALGEMSGGIAHEINNPLAIISGKTQLLLKGLSKLESVAEAEKLKNYLLDIKRTTDRIATIIKGLKSFARDAAKDPFLPAPVSQIIDETLAFCEARFASQSIEVRKVNTTTAVMIECRSAQISQVLLNALNNSYDAIEKILNPWIEIEVIELESSIKIVITDCGPGIPKEVRDKLMNPFFTTKDVGKGTGLGLSLSRGIIESHHGKFGFDFEYKNTRIVVELPKTQTTNSQ